MDFRRIIFVWLGALSSHSACYVEDDGDVSRQEMADEFDLDCVGMPPECEFSEEYSTCATISRDADPCAWEACDQFEGIHSRWLEQRRCLRDICGIPFSDKCAAQYQVLQSDCFDNNCSDDLDASACNGYSDQARNICG